MSDADAYLETSEPALYGRTYNASDHFIARHVREGRGARTAYVHDAGRSSQHVRRAGRVERAVRRHLRVEDPSEELAAELMAFAKTKLAPYKYPRWIEFVA